MFHKSTNLIMNKQQKISSSTAANTRTVAIPRVLLMGPNRNGKTSIRKVVFEKSLLPPQTVVLEETNEIELLRVANNDLVPFEVWDFPGDFVSQLIGENGSNKSSGGESNNNKLNVAVVSNHLQSQQRLVIKEKDIFGGDGGIDGETEAATAIIYVLDAQNEEIESKYSF
jgi:hypothetical protein